MIGSLTGILKIKSPTEVLLDVNGVGYTVSIPFSTFEKLGDAGSKTELFTHLHVREDAMQLFGFKTEDERYFFRLLISVNGIGPKIAQGILSGISVTDLRQHISKGNLSALTTIPGIGKKTAERLVVELRDRLGKLTLSAEDAASEDQSEFRQEALLALTSLGYNRPVAEKALRQVLHDVKGETLSLQDLIKRALRLTTSGS